MTDLGPEWVHDADGIPHRQAARLVLFDVQGRVLLAIGHDDHQPDRQWWFTIGGGLDEGESPRQGAVRELFEETGIVVSETELVGPVMYRQAEFDFLNVTARQDEWFFVAHTPTTSLDTANWTDLERQVIDGQRWWDLDELEAEGERVAIYPTGFTAYARQWSQGWDGTLIRLAEGRALDD